MLSDLFSGLSDIISHLILTFNYAGIFFLAFIENVISPIPSEFIFPWAGFLASEGKINFWGIVLAGAVGATVAAWLLYYLGSKFNGPKTRLFVDKYGKYLLIKLSDLEKAEKWFEKYGVWTVFIFRFVPLGRSIISIPAGFVKINFWKFTILTFAGTFIWSAILTYAGYQLGENWTIVVGFLNKYQELVIILIILGVIGFLYLKRKDLIDLIKGSKKADGTVK